MSSRSDASTNVVTTADSCRDEIRSMVLAGVLLPGQKINQADLAVKLRVSRVPVREALSSLQAEGVVDLKPNVGYTVARFDMDELAEIYLMRRLLETELLRSLDLGDVDTSHMDALNTALGAVSFAGDRKEFNELNRRFHFELFDQSPLRVVRQEVARLWQRSLYYRRVVWSDAGSAHRICHEHAVIISAIRAGDIEGLVAASDAHRSSTEELAGHRVDRLC